MFVRVLGMILREELGFKINSHEEWTFEHAADYDIPDGDLYEHECSAYLGVGRAEILDSGVATAIEIRVLIEWNNWTALSKPESVLWNFYLWIKTPQGESASSFIYTEPPTESLFPTEEFDSARRIPRKIAFWRDKPLANAA